MTQILFVFPAAPLAANYSGAASRYAQNFAAMCELYEAVHVARIGDQATFEQVLAFERTSPEAAAAHQAAISWQDLSYTLPDKIHQRFDLLTEGVLDPVKFEFPTSDLTASLLDTVISNVKPDLIWVEHIEPAAAISRLDLTVPWVFSNHDLAHRIRKIRTGDNSLKKQWRLNICQRAEKKVLLSADTVVTGSFTDCERLKGMGHHQVFTIPMAYQSIPDIDVQGTAATDLRITHLGSLETTANRVGLEAYLQKAHQAVIQSCERDGRQATLVIIGDASRLKEPLASLLKQANAELKGFVSDLDSVLRPFDISILPYEHDSGYRTKLPLLLSYGQVVVSTHAAVAGTRIKGLDKVSILLDSLDDFPNAIAELAANPTRREQLGRAARQFFEDHFTYNGMMDHYNKMLAGAGMAR